MPLISELRIDQRQQTTLSPRLQNAVRLLQMSSQEFAEELGQLLERNPFLEDADEALPPGADEPLAAEPEDSESPLEPEGDGAEWALAPGSAARESAEPSPLELMAYDRSLAEHLCAQLQWLHLPPRDLALALAVASSLDDDGYLRVALEDVIAPADLDPPADAQELHIALRRVQSLEPCGVGARGVSECLLLQAAALDDPRLRTLALRIIRDCLEALASRDAARIAERLDCALGEVQAACERIRHFDPRPGWRHGASHTAYITPDVIVRQHRGAWRATLNPAVVPRLRLNQVYAELFEQQRRTSPNGEMASHLLEARSTLRGVSLRFATIVSVAQAIIDRQKHFLSFGAMAMKPLVLREIAEALAMHESTVSRVTNNKYMATPTGIFELKYFFSRPMTSLSGTAFSGTAVKGLIREMIDGEAPQCPLSDAEICRQLARQGLCVARRTVTKYRQLLHIETAERRRAPAEAGG